jgi:carbon-monoxide dehydrogenase large subunit
MGIEGIGARVARKEDKRFITGAGRYVDDMVVPGMKHAMFVRSPHAHAQIKKIDVKAVLAASKEMSKAGKGKAKKAA